jgi:DNA-binding transcriptional regulator YiaG
MNIGIAIRHEIARVARKELKDEIAAVRKHTTAHRSEIAALKREVKDLHTLLKALRKALPIQGVEKVAAEAPAPETRAGRRQRPFSADQLLAHRQKLGITQAQMAQLMRVSALSVYKWESGKVSPRAAQLQLIAATLKLGKRAALAKLQSE